MKVYKRTSDLICGLFAPILMFTSFCRGQEQSIFPENGYYSYHPAYYHDLPPARPLPAKIPFGMPIGGYSASGQGPPYGLVAFYVDTYGHQFELNNPWNYFLLKQLLKLSSELTARFVPIDNSLMDGPLIWEK